MTVRPAGVPGHGNGTAGCRVRSAAGRSSPFPGSDVRPEARGLLPVEARPEAAGGQYTSVDKGVDNVGRTRSVAVDIGGTGLCSSRSASRPRRVYLG